MMLSSDKNENWSCKLKDMLCRYGFSEKWSNQKVQHEGEFLREFRRRMICEYNTMWSETLNSSIDMPFIVVSKYYEVEKCICTV